MWTQRSGYWVQSEVHVGDLLAGSRQAPLGGVFLVKIDCDCYMCSALPAINSQAGRDRDPLAHKAIQMSRVMTAGDADRGDNNGVWLGTKMEGVI